MFTLSTEEENMVYHQKLQLNTIICADNVQYMQTLPSQSIDLIFADPPYNLQLNKELFRINGTKFAGVDDAWDKYTNYADYDQECQTWLSECLRLLKNNGSLWVIGSYHNIHRIGYLLQNMHAWIINEIIWEKTNPVPNFHGTRFVNAQENLLWVVKNKKSKFTFHYKTMKNINDNKQMKSVWRIPIATGQERLRDANNQKIHSTQKPLKLLEWIILASSKYNDIVLDPFSGTGTTAHACKKWGRNYIAIEKESKYYQASQARLAQVVETKETIYKKALLDAPLPKVHFKDLIAAKYLSPTDVLHIKHLNMTIHMNHNGNVFFNNTEMSPNKLLKTLFQKPLNAWDYLILHNKPISYYRDKYRKEILHYENPQPPN